MESPYSGGSVASAFFITQQSGKRDVMSEAAILQDDKVCPLFPEPKALDWALYDYLRRADRMGWSPYDLVDQEHLNTFARPTRLTRTQVEAVKTVLFVE